MTWWPNLVTWVLVLLGWYAVHLATLSRERRKERRQLAQEAIEALRELGADACRFHTADSFDSVRADELVYKTGRSIRALQRVPMSHLDVSLARMIRVRKSITLANFDKSTFQTQVPGSQLLLDIRAAIDDLIDAIEESRDAKWT